MYPVQTLFLTPVSNSKLAESMTHHFLSQERISSRNELFDLTGKEDKLADCLRHVTAFDLATGLPRPSLPNPSDAKPGRPKKNPVVVAQGVSVRETKQKLSQEELEAKVEAQEREKQRLRQQEEEASEERAIERVQAFAQGAVKLGDSQDFVQVRSLFSVFDSALQEAETVHVSNKVFQKGLMCALDNQRFKLVHNYTIDGKKQKARSVFMGYTMK